MQGLEEGVEGRGCCDGAWGWHFGWWWIADVSFVFFLRSQWIDECRVLYVGLGESDDIRRGMRGRRGLQADAISAEG